MKASLGFTHLYPQKLNPITDNIMNRIHQKVSEVRQRLSGITCGYKGTSCPDQLAQLLAALR